MRNLEILRAIELIDTTFVEDATVDAACTNHFRKVCSIWRIEHGNGLRYFRFSLLNLRDILSERDRFAEILQIPQGLIR